MAHIYDNDECPSNHFGDSLQYTNWILDSRATCHMTPDISDFIPSLLYETDRNIEVADIYHFTKKYGKYE